MTYLCNMKLIIYPANAEPFEVEVTREYSQGVLNYGFKHPIYRGFQFDDNYRPNSFNRPMKFHGYLIAKKGYGHEECSIKVIPNDFVSPIEPNLNEGIVVRPNFGLDNPELKTIKIKP